MITALLLSLFVTALLLFPSLASASLPPDVATTNATVTGQTTATITGTVNPEGLVTTYRVAYDLSTAPWCDILSGSPSYYTAPVTLGFSDSTAHDVSVDMTGLGVSTSYCAEIIATNASGTSGLADYGQVWFYTDSLPGTVPAAGPLSITSVTQTTATISDVVNPGVSAPDGINFAGYNFYYVTRAGNSCQDTLASPGAHMTVISATFPGSNTTIENTPVTISENIAGLTQGTTYCLGLDVWNNNSSLVSANIAEFTTLPPPVAPDNTVVPKIKGKAKSKSKLKVSSGTWTGTAPMTYAYQWSSCNAKGKKCKAVRGAKKNVLKLTKKNVGRRMRVAVTATNAAGKVSAASKTTAVVKK